MDSILQGLSSGLAAAAAGIATTCLLRSIRPSARRDGSTMIVEYGRTMKVFAVVFWFFVAGASVATVFAPASDRMMAICVVGVFFLMILALHLEFFHVRICYDPGGLHLASPWRRSRFVPWSAITGARFSPVLQWYVLSTTKFGRIRLHLYLSGLQSLLDELLSRGIAIPAAARRHK